MQEDNWNNCRNVIETTIEEFESQYYRNKNVECLLEAVEPTGLQCSTSNRLQVHFTYIYSLLTYLTLNAVNYIILKIFT